jgi:prophage tail gpP-like protein
MNSPEVIVEVTDPDNPGKPPVAVRPLGYSIRHDMRESPDSFDLTVSPFDGGAFKLAGMQKTKIWFNRPGKGATLRMVGRTDERTGGTTDGGRDLSITGRDMSLHLIDTDAPPGSIKNISLQKLAEKYATPFGIAVQVPGFPNAPVNSNGDFSFVLTDPQLDTYKMAGRRGGKKHKAFTAASNINKKDWRVQPNTPCWDVLSKYGQQVGVVPFMLGQAICLTRPNYLSDLDLYGDGLKTTTAGSNTLSADLRISAMARYAVYKAKTKGSTAGPTKTVTIPGFGTVKKKTVKSVTYRDYVIDPSPAFWEDTSFGLLARFAEQSGANVGDRHGRVKEVRGEWFGDRELMRRALRSEMERRALEAWEYRVDVRGLTAENGSYWTQDTMVKVIDDTQEGISLFRPLYIVAVEESQASADEKPVTSLDLIPPKIWLWYNDASPQAYAANIRRQMFY